MTPVAAAVIVHAGRLLLVRRAVPEGPLVWQLPAGKVGPGEDPKAAAAREALEEAGVTVESLRLLGERTHPATGRPMSYWACRLVAGTAQVASEQEVAEVRWVSQAEIQGLIPGGLFAPVQAWLDEQLSE